MWAADYRSVTVAFTCERGDDARTVLRNATETEASPAAAADDQVATYTASVKFFIPAGGYHI